MNKSRICTEFRLAVAAILIVVANASMAQTIVVTPSSAASYLYIPSGGVKINVSGGVASEEGEEGVDLPEPQRTTSPAMMSCEVNIKSGYRRLIAPSDAKIYYTITGGGGGGGGLGGNATSGVRQSAGGGGGGSSAILINGVLARDEVTDDFSVGNGGAGSNSNVKGLSGQTVKGGITIKRGDEIEIFVGGGGSGAMYTRGGDGGIGYFGGGGGASTQLEANGNTGGKGGGATGGTGGVGQYRSGAPGGLGFGGIGANHSAASTHIKGGGDYGSGGGGARQRRGGRMSGDGREDNRNSDNELTGGRGGKGTLSGSNGSGNGPGSVKVQVSAFQVRTDYYGSGGDAGKIFLKYQSDFCWIQEW